MKDIVAKITAVWNSLAGYLFDGIKGLLNSNSDKGIIDSIKALIEKALGTADVVADQVEEAE